MTDWIHPALIFLAGALVLPLLKGHFRQLWQLAIPLAALASVAIMTPGEYGGFNFVGQKLLIAKVDKLALVFAWVFTIMAVIGCLYSLHVRSAAQHVAAFLYVGSALGVVFAGDWFTLLVSWEIMAFASAYLIFAADGLAATRAGMRYLMVHVTGGVLLFGGIVLHGQETGSYLFGPIAETGGLAYSLILISFIINAAVPPLNAWLTDAYPEATVTGAVFLSAFTTKTAIYVLIRAYPGTEVLVWLGAVMALYGVIYAVLENDCRRLLAYHIVSQVGYMVAGVGIGTEMALNGSASHAFAHIIYKGLLFMGAGAVIHMTGRRKLTELGGLYRTMPWTVALYMIGAFAISAFPLFSGFVSKSMVVAAAAGDQRAVIVLMLTVASSGTFLHTGLKLPYYMFFGRDCGLRPTEPPINMLLAMGIAAVLCVGIGVLPGLLYGMLPHPVNYHPYTGAHVTESLNILMFTALAFFLFLRSLDPERTISLDTDWAYRRGSGLFMWVANRPLARWEQMITSLSDTVIWRWLNIGAHFSLIGDLKGVDAVVNSVARTALRCGAVMRRVQSGVVSHYAGAMISGVLACIALYVFLWAA
ncbi:Na(+)/H(+) antiporter subunit D [Pelagibius sp. Alg239-R121]|uniref:Na(+)/H(+) antiporter subunit D n=1 Tax=Pelagibius sp. Alg239-R121 TaxID=2993448 RepID=UPI0024A75ACE|nr:Na(+)/H(+) antiporter subunit D [Pelagibius sp. Alg239-R121]